MTKKLVAQIILYRLSQISLVAGRLGKRFEGEDVHQLRLQIKKLRSAIRMLRKVTPEAASLKIPASIRSLYEAAGKARNADLALRNAENLNNELGDKWSDYASYLRRELARAKEELVLKLPSALHLKRARASLIKDLPDDLHKSDVVRFMKNRNQRIQQLLKGQPHYYEMHQIRKKLKDIQYVGALFKDLLSAREKSEMKMASVALGRFCDAFVEMDYLNHFMQEVGPRPSDDLRRLHRLLTNDSRRQEAELNTTLKKLTIHPG